LAVIIPLLALLSACLPPPDANLLRAKGEITILHSNDTHGSLDDVARRAALVSQARQELGADKMLLLDAGDAYAGTPYFTLFSGLADLWFMNSMAYDAMAVGNHEFDLGPAGLTPFIDAAKFPVLSANFDFRNEPALKGKIPPWTIVTRNGVKYGVFGLTTLDARTSSKPGAHIIYTSQIQAARAAVSALQAKDIKCIIALSHLGWENDLELARQVGGIDVIIGGHSHTVPDKYPTAVIQGAPPTLVAQAGAFNQYLGRLNVRFDQEGVIQTFEGALARIDDKVAPDPTALARLAEYKGPVDALMAKPVGRAMADLDGERLRVRTQETNLGDLVADAFLAEAAPRGAVLALVNSGSIRASIPAGGVSLGQVMGVLPMQSFVTLVDLTGQQVIDALENSVSLAEQANGRFLQVSGLRFNWDPGAPSGRRVVKVEVGNAGGYQPLDPRATYRAAVSDWMTGGGDGYGMVKQGRNILDTGVFDREALTNYIKARGTVEGKVEGRITRVSGP
jgi:5'-nucleotidase